jgi:hypothetical protein
MEKHNNATDPLSDAVIERYVRCPQTLGAELRDKVAACLAENPEAQSVAEFYRDCYSRLDRLGTRSPQQLEQFIASIFPIPDVVPLYPMAAQSPRGPYTSPPKLQATRPGGAGALFEPQTLLGSRETTTMVCLLRNQDDYEDWKLFVLTTDLLKRANTLVTFSELGVDVVVDGSGSADFRLPDKDLDVELLNTATLRLPVVEIIVHENEVDASIGSPTQESVALPSGHVVHLDTEFDGRLVWLDSSRAAFSYRYRRITCTNDDGTIEIRRIIPEGMPARIRTTADIFTIRLYE